MAVRTVDANCPLPRYQQVYQSLVERIARGEFPVGSTLPAERQLAKDYGVSRITIIKALGKLAQEGIVERRHGRGTFVLRPVEAPASAAHSAPGRTIAFLANNVGHIGHPILYDTIMGIAEVAAAHQYHLQMVGPYESPSEERERVGEVMAAGVAGLIIWPHGARQNAAFYRGLAQRGFPVVLVDRYYPDAPNDHVVYDDEAAGYELTTALIAKGHRRVGAIAYGEFGITSVRNRLYGYRRALEAHGLPYDERLIWLDVYSTDYPVRDPAEQESAFRERLRRRLQEDRATALMAINLEAAERVTYDLMAINAARIVASQRPLGLDLAAVSASCSTGHAVGVVALAVQSGRLLGARAAEMLLSRLEGGLPAAPQSARVPMNIIGVA